MTDIRQREMTFGKHKGTPLDVVPDSYLIWLYGQDWLKRDHSDVYSYIVENTHLFDDLILRPEDVKKENKI